MKTACLLRARYLTWLLRSRPITRRITIKLHLTGKPRLIFKFLRTDQWYLFPASRNQDFCNWHLPHNQGIAFCIILLHLVMTMMIILISVLIYAILFQRNIFEEVVMPPVKGKVLDPEVTLFNRTQNFLFMITTKRTYHNKNFFCTIIISIHFGGWGWFNNNYSMCMRWIWDGNKREHLSEIEKNSMKMRCCVTPCGQTAAGSSQKTKILAFSRTSKHRHWSKLSTTEFFFSFLALFREKFCFPA